MAAAELDSKLRQALCNQPRRFDNKYTSEARSNLLDFLFRSLTNDRPDYLQQLFPNGFPRSYSLQEAQGAREETEYSEGARGHLCGHILKYGEASYHCMTCTDDPTACLCSRCFAASDHEGHQFHISQAVGNSGCCDCGDEEAWKRPVHCAIHTATDGSAPPKPVQPALPEDLQIAVRTTISRALDYFCDVISCAPENLRMPKTEESVKQDELCSRLKAEKYITGDEVETNPEYSLVMWNDEKHTIEEVEHQVSRACRVRAGTGKIKANEANDTGRTVVTTSRNLKKLIDMATIIEQIKVTVTIRSSRDTFREQMCGTIIEWLSDICGCHLMGDTQILRRIVCEEMLQIWRVGSEAWNARVGKGELDDHEYENNPAFRDPRTRSRILDSVQIIIQQNQEPDPSDDEDEDMDDDNDGIDAVDLDDDEFEEQLQQELVDNMMAQDGMEVVRVGDDTSDNEEMDTDGDNDFLDAAERLDVDGPAPPPPPPPPAPEQNAQTEPAIAASTEELSRQPSGTAAQGVNENFRNIPRSNRTVGRIQHLSETSHWRLMPPDFKDPSEDEQTPVWENLRKNIRVDSMIMFDLRLWKEIRVNLREMLLSTVVKIPEFKRILGLRFAGSYTTLAHVYLVADREPDHSIIQLSLQLLTTPSITEEVVEKGNFLTKLMAILYTFLTTRQVGFPGDVDPVATLGFDAGSVANRRLYHFFSDLRYFLASPFIQSRVRSEPQYLLQYLDLAKLSQGICPNVRAVGDHVEYETDAWISASLLTQEINKLCRQFTEAYQSKSLKSPIDESLYSAIEQTAMATILSCSGLEYKRFEQSEIKGLVKFHNVGPFRPSGQSFKTVDFMVDKGTLSFHHPLHYTLSWLLENGKDSPQSVAMLRETANNVVLRFKENAYNHSRFPLHAIYDNGEDALLALFDYPLRVCAWLAQMKANMWVRNGMSLRHQMNRYKSVTYRDVGHHRDLFLLQTALVACNPARVLASMIDRFGLTQWNFGIFQSASDADEGQQLDIAEEFTYLLINILSDRDSLSSISDDPESQLSVLRKDVAHTLCFKPLSYTDLTNRLTERAQDHEKLQEVLDSMTVFRPPEGLHDSGLFELKPENLQELDPYNSHFSKNQRDEAENIYKKWMAKKVNKSPDDIVLEPKLNPIRSEAYGELCAVIHEPLFVATLHSMLLYVVSSQTVAASVSASRVESFLHVVLHLALIAALEDVTIEDSMLPESHSFTKYALSFSFGDDNSTILSIFNKIWKMDEFSSSRSKIRHILRLFHRRWPLLFTEATKSLDFPAGRFDTSSPANIDPEIEAKKKQAMERKAKILAQMQQQQQNFMQNQVDVDWGDEDLDDADPEIPTSTETRLWKFPSGVCIQCREETGDARLYGTFAMITDAHVLRVTPTHDPDFAREALLVPQDLDHSIESMRPFGVSGANHEEQLRLAADGSHTTVDRQSLSKGWPRDCTQKGAVSTSCGHIMHYSCFENYYQSVLRKHGHQIARCHPERTDQNEFVCPLCKALNNVFLPIAFKSSEQAYPGILKSESTYEFFLEEILSSARKSFESLESSGGLPEFLEKSEKEAHAQSIMSFSTNAMMPLVKMLQDANSPLEWAESTGAKPLLELSSIYKRLSETLDIISKTQLRPSNPGSREQLEILLSTLANSVTSVEIAYRGRESDGTCLLDGITSQTMSHLQVLAHSVHSYAATMALTNTGDASAYSYRDAFKAIMRQLFALSASKPILTEDAFSVLSRYSFVLSRMQGFPINHLLRLCLTLEMLRVAIWWLRDGRKSAAAPGARLPPKSPRSAGLSREEYSALGGFIFWLATSTPGERNQPLLPVDEVGPLLSALRSYALVFMRKAVILLHVAHGVDFPSTAGLVGKPELERLLSLCQLPDLVTILSSFSEFTVENALPNLARDWLKEWSVQSQSLYWPIKLGHPAPFELIGLPKYYDVLMEECHKRKCPRTGKELADPALCLFCGEIFCSQAFCCMSDKRRGGCNHHLEDCSSPIGIFLFIRKCNVVLLDVRKDPKKAEQDQALRESGQEGLALADLTDSHGSFFPAPYLTKHGETDQGLRSKHQLILNQKRYDKLVRDAWLMVNGSVWSTVARKLEGEVNAGGWETL